MCVSSLETCPRRSWHSSTRELPWSVLNAEIARRIGLLDAQGEPLTLSTRTGKVFGKLVRAPVSLVADAGESLELDATFFVSADWRHGTFLGYSGLLEWMRFAIDPYRNLAWTRIAGDNERFRDCRSRTATVIGSCTT